MIILSVNTVKSSTINSSWRRGYIQVVTTDVGEFIDTAPNTDYTTGSKYFPGYNWKNHINEDVSSTSKIVTNNGYKWIKRK